MFYFCLLLIHESIGFGLILTDLDIIVILKYRIGRIFIESGLGVDRSRLKWKIEARIILELVFKWWLFTNRNQDRSVKSVIVPSLVVGSIFVKVYNEVLTDLGSGGTSCSTTITLSCSSPVPTISSSFLFSSGWSEAKDLGERSEETHVPSVKY